MTPWTVVRLQRSLGKHNVDWDRLNERSFGSHPLLSSVFVEGLLRNFGAGSEYLCVLEQSGQVAAMCVLRKQGRFAWSRLMVSRNAMRTVLKTAYDERYGIYAPGRMMLRRPSKTCLPRRIRVPSSSTTMPAVASWNGRPASAGCSTGLSTGDASRACSPTPSTYFVGGKP